jgi:phage protein D
MALGLPTTEDASRSRAITNAYVTLDGADLASDLLDDLLRVRIDGSVHLPDLAILEFDNAEMYSDMERIRIGQEITIGFGDSDESSDEPCFVGEVTAVEVEFGMEGDVKMIVRCYDRAHRLHRGRHTKVYLQMTDSDIATQIAAEMGFQTSEIQSTSGVHDYVLQEAESHWEFLQKRAALHGFELQVSEKKLVFKPPPSVEREEVDLTWTNQLDYFRGTITTGDQVNKVEVRGWDPVNKQTILGTAESSAAESPQTVPDVPGPLLGGNDGGSVSKMAFQKQAVMVVARQPIFDQAEADRLAKSVLEDLAGSFITAHGIAAGDTTLQLGSTVNIEGVGRQFEGSYTVTQIAHLYEPEDYKIEFEVTGRRSTDMVSLLQSPREPRMILMNGLVKDLNDPLGLGRVKVTLPWLGDDIDTNWCRLVIPGGGPSRGIHWGPDVDDEVLLIGNSMDNLYILGGLYNQDDQPPYGGSAAGTGSETHKRVMRSREGHEVLIDDSTDTPRIEIVDKNGNIIQIDSREDKMTIEMAKDIKIKAGGNIEIEATGNIKMSATGNLDATAMGNATVEATGQATLKGTAGVRAESSANAALSAPTVSLG